MNPNEASVIQKRIDKIDDELKEKKIMLQRIKNENTQKGEKIMYI